MKTQRGNMEKIIAIGLLMLITTSYGATNEITGVSPNTAAAGTTNLTITFTLDSDVPPPPPAGITPGSVTIGGLSGTSLSHSSQDTVTAVFNIPAEESIGTKDVSISFTIPNDTLVFSMVNGFTVTEAVDTPPSITQHPQSRSVVSQSTVTFTVQAAGTVPLDYQWQKDQADIPGETSSSLELTSVTAGDQGQYRCVVTNDLGTAVSNAALLTVGNVLYYPIVDTAQTACYNDIAEMTPPSPGAAYYGQDAQINGNQPGYTMTDGGLTVTDNVTGLMWTQTADINADGLINVSDKLTYAQAIVYADDTLNVGSGYAGYTGWRLPSIKELYSLMNFTGEDPSGYTGTDTSGLIPFIDTNYFGFGYGDTGAGERIIDAQWASTTLYTSTTMDGNATMFGLNLADGRIKGYPRDGKLYYVYFVRGNTGYGVNNFVDNTDGTISDRATGLMWAQDDSGAGSNWAQALAWVQTKNSQSYLGYNDWRLPNVKELQSIIDYTRSPDATGSAAIDPVFNTTAITNEAGQVDYPCYWSGTTHATSADTNNGGSGAYVAFGRAMGYWNSVWQDVHGAGAQRSDPKSGDPADWPTGHGPQGDAIRIYNYVRLVRTTQCGEPGHVSGLDGDLNNDCYVDMIDVAELGLQWQAGYDIVDLSVVAENWLSCNVPECLY